MKIKEFETSLVGLTAFLKEDKTAHVAEEKRVIACI